MNETQRFGRAGTTWLFWTVVVLLSLVGVFLAVHGQTAGELLHRAARFARGAGGARTALCCLVFCLAGALAINSPIPLAAFFKVGGGFLFGAVLGSAVNIAMALLGALIGFASVRRMFRERAASRFGGRLRAVDAEIVRGGFWYVLSCRLGLLFPFAWVNAAAGLSGMAFWDFLWASFFGSLPVAVMYATAGAALSDWSLSGAAPSGGLAALWAILALAALLPPLAMRFGWGKKMFCRLGLKWGLPSGLDLANKTASPRRGSSVGRAGD